LRADTLNAAMQDIVGAVFNHSPLRVAFANTHLLYCALHDPGYARLMRSFYVVNDGIGMDLLSRLSCGRGFTHNLNGTDLTPKLLHAMPWGTRVMLVGSKPAVVKVAAHRTERRFCHLDVCAVHDGFDGKAVALDTIAQTRPDVVLVGMGNPTQEKWIEEAAERVPHAVFLGVGAYFDFLADAVPRAPPLVRRLHLEWAFRFAHEPRRLWRRYTVELFVVLSAIISASYIRKVA
jgi:exopolysaccharide biosynthesis WecB/TagA/CpsF family protein